MTLPSFVREIVVIRDPGHIATYGIPVPPEPSYMAEWILVIALTLVVYLALFRDGTTLRRRHVRKRPPPVPNTKGYHG